MERTPDEYLCPITQCIMVEPVIGSDGNTYEKSAITEWLRTNTTSPVTRQPMRLDSLRPNYALRSMIERYNTNSASYINNDHSYAIQILQEDAKALYSTYTKPPPYVPVYKSPPPPPVYKPLPPPPPSLSLTTPLISVSPSTPVSSEAANAKQKKILCMMIFIIIGIVVIVAVSRAI